MADVVATDAGTRSFPFNIGGMILGAVIAGLGLFLISTLFEFPNARIIGLVLFLIGIIIFAL